MALDKVVDSAALDAGMTAVADEIRAKTGTTEPLAWPDGFRAAISGIETGGGGSSNPTAAAKAVNFRDYDGTVLYSYTVDEAAALTELPALPSHDGLTCQGWNWSLANIKALGRAVTVGAMYITDDGKTRIYIHLEEGRTSPMLGCCPNGTVTVDWGDGTEPDTLTGTSVSTVKWTPTHEYSAAGDYVIKLSVVGSVGLAGNNPLNEYSYILRYSSGADSRNRVYQNAIRKVEIGDSVTEIFGYAFQNCYSLSSITIPDSVTSIGMYAFQNCYSLSSIMIPNSVTTINGYAFQSCYSLSSIIIPNSVIAINGYAFNNCYSLSSIMIPNSMTEINAFTFQNCYSLSSIMIPNSVTSIGMYAFQNCYSLSSIMIPNSVIAINGYAFNNCSGVRYYDFTRHAAVPTLSSADAFSNIAADCEIRIPIALYEEWTAATNWSTYADHIVYVGTPYYLDVSSNDGGTVTPTGQVFAPPGCTRTLKIVPDGTHELSDITLDGTSVKSAVIYVDGSSNAWTVETVDGASYGFALNTNGYYESQNKGKSNSAAVCKIAITVAMEMAMSLDIINSGESNYDYGLLGAVDQVLTTTSTADSGVAWSGKGKSSTSVVNVPFTIPAGTHYIYAKFIKDGSGDQGNDSLQFKANLPTESYWSYTIENVQSDHDIVVTFGAKGA